jgi:hypothetical protein
VYLVFVREAAGSVVMYAVVSLLLVWADSDLLGFGLELVGLARGASRLRHLHILSVHRICVASSRWGFFGKGRACRGSHRRIPNGVVGLRVPRYGAG